MKVHSGIIRTLSILITVITGILFLWSGYTKLFPAEYFETVIAERAGTDTMVSAWMARIIIGAEWMLGGMLLIRWRLKKVTMPATLFVLALFCILLVYQLITDGNDNNCGCFGNVWIMSPVEALIKNFVMAGLLYGSVRLSTRSFTLKKVWLIPLFVLGMSLPFVFNPGEIVYPSPVFLSQPEKIELDILYTDSANVPPSKELRSGKHIIAFMSLKCKHCRLAGYKMAVMYSQHPDLPFYLVLNGDSSKLNDFFRETGATNIPHSMFFGPEKFLSLSGTGLPAIFLVNNGYTEGRMNYRSLDLQSIQQWLTEQNNPK